jgi:hypothetical protein
VWRVRTPLRLSLVTPGGLCPDYHEGSRSLRQFVEAPLGYQ